VGLGTTTPLYKFDIHKTLSTPADANIHVYNPSDNDGDKSGIRFGVGSFWAVHLNTVLNGNWLELTNNSGTPYHRWTQDSYYPGTGGSAYIMGTGSNLALMGGYTGIGTNTPNRHLEVVSSNYKVARLTGTGAGAGLELRSQTREDWLITTWNDLLYLTWSNDEFATQADQFAFSTGSFYPWTDNTKTLGNGGKRWTSVYAINGTIQTSDRRLKTNIKPLKYGLDEVLQMKPVSYSWKSDLNSKKIGLIAQEIQDLVPEVITVDETLGMNYAELVPVLINAIQEQEQKIKALEAKVESLSRKNSELENIQAEVTAIKKALGLDAKAQK
jgi:Chaperone of endosialidase